MILISIAKMFVTHLFNCMYCKLLHPNLLLCPQTLQYESPESKFDISIKMSRSTEDHHENIFGQKFLQFCMEFYVLEFSNA